MKKANTRSRGNSKATSRSAALEARARLEREQEEEILSLLRKEADAFVPNVYPSAKKKAGLLAPIETREELSLTEILGNEGNKMVPDLEKLIYQKTGARKSFRLGNHLNFRRTATAIGTCLSLVFIVAAAVAVTSALPAGPGAPGALIRLSIAPASSQNAERSVSEAPVNPYKPEFLLVPTSDAKIYQEGLSPMNLSATYVVDGLDDPETDNLTLEEAFSALFEGSYQTGYIEAKTPASYNVIDVSIVTDQDDYEDLYVKVAEKALRESLRKERIYAKLNLTCSLLEPSLSKMDYLKAADTFTIYELLNRSVDYEKLLNESASVIESLESVGESLAAAPLSDLARVAISRGLSMSYNIYSEGASKNQTKEEVERLKEDLIAKIDEIPWNINPSLLGEDPYYLLNDPEYYEGLAGDAKKICETFFKIQRAILDLAGSSKENYLQFLAMTNAFLASLASDPSDCPDPYGYPYDPGGHSPGTGPNSANWGDGEIVLA